MKQFLVTVLLLVGLSVSAQKKWTLLECVNHALENNITVKQGQNTLLLNEQDIIAAKGQYLPSVSANASQSLNTGTSLVAEGLFADRTSHSTNFGVRVNETIFDGFRVKNNYKQSQLIKESNELELARIKDDISLNVVNAYLNVLFNKENLETALAQYEFSKKQVDQVKELVEAGSQAQADVFDAEATLATDKQSITTAENNYNLALLSLSQFLQIPFDGFEVEIIDVDTPSNNLLYNDVKPILEYAFQNRNEIKVAEKNIENSKLNTKISKGGYLPSLTFGYSFGINAFFDNNEFTSDLPFFDQVSGNKGHGFNLNLSVPVFSRFSNKTAVAKSKIQEDNALLNLEQQKLNLEATIQRAFADAKAAFNSYLAAKESLESQQLAFNNSQERYNIGNVNAFNLEQARIRLINAQNSLTNAKYDFVFRTKVLDFYIGKPITVD